MTESKWTIAFEARELACRRGGRPVFEGLSFSLSSGDALVLKGPNGSGKSSTLRILAGLGSIASGSLHLDGEAEATRRDELSALCHFYGHQTGLKPGLTVLENISFWANLYGPGSSDEEACEKLGLAKLMHLPVRILSDGTAITSRRPPGYSTITTSNRR